MIFINNYTDLVVTITSPYAHAYVHKLVHTHKCETPPYDLISWNGHIMFTMHTHTYTYAHIHAFNTISMRFVLLC